MAQQSGWFISESVNGKITMTSYWKFAKWIGSGLKVIKQDWMVVKPNWVQFTRKVLANWKRKCLLHWRSCNWQFFFKMFLFIKQKQCDWVVILLLDLVDMVWGKCLSVWATELDHVTGVYENTWTTRPNTNWSINQLWPHHKDYKKILHWKKHLDFPFKCSTYRLSQG